MIRKVFEYGPLLAWMVLLFTLVRSLKLGRAASCALGFVLLLASQKFLLYKFFGGDSFVPDLPELLVNFTGWTYSASMMLFGGSSLWWLFRLGQRGWRHFRGAVPDERRDTRLDRRVLVVIAVAAMLVAGWGIWEGVRVPRVREVQVPVRNLPKAFDGFRLVQLSDLHCSPAARRGRTEGIVEVVNGLRADLICITGDFVDGSPADRRDDLAPLARLQAVHGVVGCAGNHEYYHDYGIWGPVFKSLGVRMLDNAHVLLTRGTDQLVVAGVTDIAAFSNQRRVMEGPDLEKAFLGVPPDACRILLQHQPYYIWNFAAQRVDLQLSGHTHGGAVLGLDLLVKRLNQNHVRGLYLRPDAAMLYVCPGTGQWAGFPLRLGVPAEISLLVLRSE